jgi:predicted TIM-barrel fold metal-dependent hydrolase
VRFNLIGAGATVLSAPDHRALIRRVAERCWQVHVQAQGPDWPAVLTALEDVDGPVIADHYGLPNPALGVGCPGFQALLVEGPQGRLFVKLSAPYRCGGGPIERYRAALLERLGPQRLLWGSDWPWTQHEDRRNYADTLADAALTAATAQRLFGFTTTAG